MPSFLVAGVVVCFWSLLRTAGECVPRWRVRYTEDTVVQRLVPMRARARVRASVPGTVVPSSPLDGSFRELPSPAGTPPVSLPSGRSTGLLVVGGDSSSAKPRLSPSSLSAGSAVASFPVVFSRLSPRLRRPSHSRAPQHVRGRTAVCYPVEQAPNLVQRLRACSQGPGTQHLQD